MTADYQSVKKLKARIVFMNYHLKYFHELSFKRARNECQHHETLIESYEINRW